MKIISNFFAPVQVPDWKKPARHLCSIYADRAQLKRDARRFERRQVKQAFRNVDLRQLRDEIRTSKPSGLSERESIGSAAFRRFMQQVVVPAPRGVSLDEAIPDGSKFTRTVIKSVRVNGKEIVQTDVCIAACC